MIGDWIQLQELIQKLKLKKKINLINVFALKSTSLGRHDGFTIEKRIL